MVVDGGLLQKVGAGTSAGTLGLLVLVGTFAREAFEAQLDATEDAVEAIEEVRDVATSTQSEVENLKKGLGAVEENGQRERAELEAKLRRELDVMHAALAELRACVEEGRRCKR